MPVSRRNLLHSAARATGAALLADGAAGAQSLPDRKLKVIVTGGHPGDPEYGCGGTVARYTDLGHQVTLLYLNRGEKSCPESEADAARNVRVGEARHACEILKARAIFAGQCDGHAVVDAAHYQQFKELIEAERPDVLFTHWPIDGHRDHRAIAMMAYDAWLALGKRFAFYYYEVSDGEDTLMFPPTDFVDITATEPRKRQACYAHASQAPDKFYALQSQVSRFRGVESGYAQAEAYVRHAQSRQGLLP
ncbi:MAG TPA: PIG-L family deacetylase [Bryobacteraceae bacterium]|nr:PIG-L family deacetylase [Bryobacteraceae bacterium]